MCCAKTRQCHRLCQDMSPLTKVLKSLLLVRNGGGKIRSCPEAAQGGGYVREVGAQPLHLWNPKRMQLRLQKKKKKR